MNNEEKTTYKILILEDIAADAELMERELRKDGLTYVFEVVGTREDFTNALTTFKPDIILADYKLPGFDGLEALEIVKAKHPACPFILVTGSMKEEDAANALKLGVADYILKGNLTRLESAVKRALLEAARIDKLQYAEGTERMNKFMIDRELKMVELKKEIAELKQRLDEK